MSKVIAVDFDGCLCESKWPDIGEARQDVINELLRQQAEGAKLILWTCREGHQLQAAVMWCLNHGIKFDAINDNLTDNQELYGNNSRKVFAHEYWDDKSVLVVSTGKVTSIAMPRSEGGFVVKQWQTKGVQFLKNPARAKPGRKRWWQRWFDGLRRGSDPLSERTRAQM